MKMNKDSVIFSLQKLPYFGTLSTKAIIFPYGNHRLNLEEKKMRGTADRDRAVSGGFRQG